jgi:hypothetical protein
MLTYTVVEQIEKPKKKKPIKKRVQKKEPSPVATPSVN